MKISGIVEALVLAGATPEMILSAVRAAEKQADDALAHRRNADAERQARKRSRDTASSSRDITLRHSDRSLTGGDARVEDNSLPQKIEPQESKKEQSAQARLEGVLDSEHAKAVVDHRQRIRKPLTAYAAKLLADKLSTFDDPNGAVDRMIERGWQTVYADERAPQARGSPRAPEAKVNSIQAAIERRRAQQNGDDGRAASLGSSPVFQLSDFSKR